MADDDRARRALAHVAALSSGPPVDEALRVTLNFHPDRLVRGRLVLAAMAEDARYLSQFATGTSNGGLTAFPGGDRWRWESRMFGTVYDDASDLDRPVYGAVTAPARAVGAAPRFGSAHLRLTAAAVSRTTFCYPDSVEEPESFGVAAAMPLLALAAADQRDALDDYVEAHVHGPVRIPDHVEALILDPSYRGSEVEVAARRLGCPVEWHGGFSVSVAELRRHPDYRGRRYVDLAAQVAEHGRLDPRMIGDAARAGRHDEQDLKRVWHYLARFGAPG
ncbi:MAG TPA: DUF3626 domain-containing protein [Motilibacteraceae bacterium]|nr:DUF3626 domain-containing protein [Motilibacteraceae bacterium]